MTKPISPEAAMRRLEAAGLTLPEAASMSDSDLLRHPSIGRRTLTFTRSWLNEQADLLDMPPHAPAYSDSTTRALDKARLAAEQEHEERKIRIVIFVLIMSQILAGMIGIAAIIVHGV